MPGLRILVVEDEVLIAEDMRIRLQGMGYQVVGTAISGAEAVQKALESRPDLILMDVRLQGAMDGVEAARRIQSQADTPIIYVTAHASTLVSAESRDGYTCLAKPFSPSQLQAAIQAVLSRTQPPAC